MTSPKGKQRKRIDNLRDRARQLASVNRPVQQTLPPGAVAADAAQLRHNNTYGVLPAFYVDKLVECRKCGTKEVWSAERQKWWYEVAKGNINTQAVFCRACREVEKQRRAEARRVHLEGLARKRERPCDDDKR